MKILIFLVLVLCQTANAGTACKISKKVGAVLGAPFEVVGAVVAGPGALIGCVDGVCDRPYFNFGDTALGFAAGILKTPGGVLYLIGGGTEMMTSMIVWGLTANNPETAEQDSKDCQIDKTVLAKMLSVEDHQLLN